MIERRIPIPPDAINFNQRVVTGGSPGLVPCRLIEGVIRVAVAMQIPQTQSEIVICLTVVRIRIAAGQSFDGPGKMRFSFGKLAPAKEPQAERVVAPGVQRVAT